MIEGKIVTLATKIAFLFSLLHSTNHAETMYTTIARIPRHPDSGWDLRTMRVPVASLLTMT